MITAVSKTRYLILLFIPFVFVASFCIEGYADTVYLKGRGPLKGIVVEDYVDRILYSTVDGEEEILKSEIVRIEYSEQADNLISLGDAAFNNGYHRTALKYYLMAQNVNPEITTLNDKIYSTERKIDAAPEIRKREHLALKTEIISGYIPSASPSQEIEPSQILKDKLGIGISKIRGRYYIEKLTGASPFKKAGMRKGDAIIAIWSKLCDYLTFKDLYELLIDPNETVLTIIVQRNLAIPKGSSFDAKLEMKWEGAIVGNVPEGGSAEKAGIRIKDHLIEVNRQSIRYTPLKKVLRWLNDRAERNIAIQRKVNIFKSL